MPEESKKEIVELLTKFKNGDDKAFKELFFMFHSDVFRFLYFFLHNKEEAEELLQDTFLNFWRSRENIDISVSPKNYLLKIARNLAINFIERERRKRKFEVCDDNIDFQNFVARDSSIEDFEITDLILSILDELPERCKEVFILSRYNNLTIKEISDLLGISVQTVKNHLTKALKHFRKRLKI